MKLWHTVLLASFGALWGGSQAFAPSTTKQRWWERRCSTSHAGGSKKASKTLPSRSTLGRVVLAPTSAVAQSRAQPAVPSSSCLWAEIDRNGYTDGTNVAPFLLVAAFAVCVWLFTIPVDLRRAKICTAQQVIDNPDSRCVTWDNWTQSVSEYYKSGGGVQFDFSVDKEDNMWI